jgi:putative ABC transport system permease protein
MNSKVFIDLTLSWFKQVVANKAFMFIMLLLAFPISILFNFQLIEQSYLNASFAGLSSNSPLRSISIHEDDRANAIEFFLADEITNKWPDVNISYERRMNAELELNANIEQVQLSFFSGGFKLLGLNAYKGTLSSLEFPSSGSALVAAITYDYWQKHFQQRNIIGKPLLIKGKAVTIVAVMPKTFKSFQKNSKVQFVMPFSQLSALQGGYETNITPDTFSYLLADNSLLNKITHEINEYFQNELLISEQSFIDINHAIGVNPSDYAMVTKRINLLKVLFLVLVIFCLVAFITYFAGENSNKQQEYLVRALCGASEQSLFYQKLLETGLTVLMISLLTVLLLPLTGYLVQLFLPQIPLELFAWQFTSFFSLLVILVLVLLVAILLIFILQNKFIKTAIGRGQSTSFSEKAQGYGLISLLFVFTIIAIAGSYSLAKQQQALYQVSLGFSAENRYIATFEPPKNFKPMMADSKPIQLLLQQLKKHPEIIDIGLTFHPPLTGGISFLSWYTSSGKAIGTSIKSLTVSDNISPQYFSALGAKLIKGRSFSWQDQHKVIVNKTLWNNYLAGQSLSQAVLLNKVFLQSGKAKMRENQVIAVVDDIYTSGPDTPPEPTVYQLANFLLGAESFVIHSTHSKAELSTIIQQEVANFDVGFKGLKITSLNELVNKENQPRYALLVVTLIATLIMFMATLIFIYNTLEQLTLKNARELALMHCVGANTAAIIKQEVLFFLSLLIPISLVFAVLSHYYAPVLMINFSWLTTLNYHLVVTAFILLLLLFIMLLAFKVKQKLQKSWVYLT